MIFRDITLTLEGNELYLSNGSVDIEVSKMLCNLVQKVETQQKVLLDALENQDAHRGNRMIFRIMKHDETEDLYLKSLTIKPLLTAPTPSLLPISTSSSTATILPISTLSISTEEDVAVENSQEKSIYLTLPSKWSIRDVGCWLHAIGFGEYADKFDEEAICGLSLFLLKTEDFTCLGIEKIGHRIQLQTKIKKLCNMYSL
uniref:SAM domain sterile alpha motif protein n=1 Tax=Pithovirus LCPAC304 TaxID=2506594 RepID=A0A481Z9A2_9VIRU|nr:MAG: SAM domain sterile alpha motif protein [Pithovirus LCPAC304]